MTTAALDHKTYPHIFELIVSFAPWPARLRLRATCRQLRDSITRDLMTHVALDTEIEDKWKGRKAFLPSGDEEEQEGDGEDDEEPFDYDDGYDENAWEDDFPEIVSVPAYPGEAVHVLPFSLEHTRTIDYNEHTHVGGDAQNNCVGHGDNKFFPSKRTIRLVQTREPDFQADNLVVFVSLPYEAEDPLYGEATERLAIHLRWDEAAQDVDYGDGAQSKYSSDVSFSGARADLVLWRDNFSDAMPDEVMRQIHCLAYSLVTNAFQGAVVTVVGADTLPPPASAEDKFKAAVKEHRDAYYHEKIDAIRFITRDAWLAELGEDRAAVAEWPVPLPPRTEECAVCAAGEPWEQFGQ